MGERKKSPATHKVHVGGFEKEYTLVQKVCPVCNEAFTGTKKAVYDRPECKRKAEYEKHKEERQRARRERYHAARKAAKKPAGKK